MEQDAKVENIKRDEHEVPDGFALVPLDVLDAMTEVVLAQPAGQVYPLLDAMRSQVRRADSP